MRLHAASALVLLAALGCSGRDVDGRAGRARASIVNGSVDNADPAVVELWIGDGDCTGTLISPHVVLTAQHCIVGSSPANMQVFFGTDANNGTNWIDVVDAQAHPSGDIAVLSMSQVGPAQPIPLSHHAFAQNDVNAPVRIVGFGVTSETGEDSGLKRQAVTTLQEWDSEFMYLNGVGVDTCYGDSGGPAFVTLDGVESVAGVTSFGSGVCGNEVSGETRVDVYFDWVQSYVAAHDELAPPSCGADGQCASGCPSVDIDCPCAADGFCRALCNDLASDPDCAGCAADGNCHSECPVPDPDCSAPAPGSGGAGNAPASGGNGGHAASSGHPKPSGSGGSPHAASAGSDSGGCNTSGRGADSSWAFSLLVLAAIGARSRRRGRAV